jgi:hypothetical protein
VVGRRLAPDVAGRKGFYRFVRHPAVTVEALLAAQAQDNGLAAYEGHVLALTDTTLVDLSAHRRRLKAHTVGPIGDGRGVGLLVHPVLCLSAAASASHAAGQVLGVSSVQVWHRPQPAADSHKWATAAHLTRAALPQARQLTLVADRESDNYATLAALQAKGIDFVLRSRVDRRLAAAGAEAPAEKLLERLARQAPQATYTVEVARTQPTPGQPTRVATLAVRYAPVEVTRPTGGPAGTPKLLTLWVVRVSEEEAAVPAGEKAVDWRLLTSHPVTDPAQAQQVVRWYAQRWWIEQLFRLLKQQGLRLEDSQLTDGAAIARLLVLALPAALQVLQLVRARDNPAPAPPSVLPPAARPLAHALVAQLNGQTTKQQNGFPAESLAWMAWLLGRLGGWGGLPSERPPGVITLLRGATLFQQRLEGWQLAVKAQRTNPP